MIQISTICWFCLSEKINLDFNHMSQQSILVFGAAITDFMAFAQDEPLRGDSVPGRLVNAPGGVGRNVAENLARLSIPVHLLSAFGDGRIGLELWESCRQVGINLEHSVRVNGQRGATHIAVLNTAGDLFAGIADLEIFKAINQALLEQRRFVFQNAKIIFVETNMPEEAIGWLCSQNDFPPIYLDPVSEILSAKIVSKLSSIHTLKCNLRQAEVLTEQSIFNENQAMIAAKTLLRRGLNRVFITLGVGGVVAADHEQCIHQASPPAQLCNTTGAGDAFSAGLIMADLKGYNLADCCRLGQRAAAITLADERACSDALSAEAILL